jgi:hypothetical protein
MRISALLSLLPLATSTILPPSNPSPPQHIFSNPSSSSDYKIPTVHESAVLARRILHLTGLGTISTVFPSSNKNAHNQENRPSDVGGLPIGLTEYIADCESNGNPTLIGVTVATYFKNAVAGSNVTLSVQWTPPHLPSKRIKSTSFLSSLTSLFSSSSSKNKEPELDVGYSAAALPRFALLGYLETVPEPEVASLELKQCFLKPHPDARIWLPGNDIHESEWVRLVVKEIYWFGGFGDRSYIGWIPLDVWQKIQKEEWESVRLPGEKKGWKEWAVEGLEL